MGLTEIKAKVGKGKSSKEVDFLVDSGAIYTLLPEKIWHELKLKSLDKVDFYLADGLTTMTRNISEVWLEYRNMRGTVRVILGEGNDTALLGITTLETLGFMLNPLSRELVPMKKILMKCK